MQKLAHDPELRVQMRPADHQRVDENFSWRVVGERLDTIYHAIIDSQ